MRRKGKEIISYIVWLCLYILCVGLGTVEEAEGFGKVLFVLTAVIFFLPGAYLLYLGFQEKHRKTVLRLRIAAICSLSLTVIAF